MFVGMNYRKVGPCQRPKDAEKPQIGYLEIRQPIRAPPGARALNLSIQKSVSVRPSVRLCVRPPVITHGVLNACDNHLIAGASG